MPAAATGGFQLAEIFVDISARMDNLNVQMPQAQAKVQAVGDTMQRTAERGGAALTTMSNSSSRLNSTVTHLAFAFAGLDSTMATLVATAHQFNLTAIGMAIAVAGSLLAFFKWVGKAREAKEITHDYAAEMSKATAEHGKMMSSLGELGQKENKSRTEMELLTVLTKELIILYPKLRDTIKGVAAGYADMSSAIKEMTAEQRAMMLGELDMDIERKRYAARNLTRSSAASWTGRAYYAATGQLYLSAEAIAAQDAVGEAMQRRKEAGRSANLNALSAAADADMGTFKDRSGDNRSTGWIKSFGQILGGPGVGKRFTNQADRFQTPGEIGGIRGAFEDALRGELGERFKPSEVFSDPRQLGSRLMQAGLSGGREAKIDNMVTQLASHLPAILLNLKDITELKKIAESEAKKAVESVVGY